MRTLLTATSIALFLTFTSAPEASAAPRDCYSTDWRKCPLHDAHATRGSVTHEPRKADPTPEPDPDPVCEPRGKDRDHKGKAHRKGRGHKDKAHRGEHKRDRHHNGPRSRGKGKSKGHSHRY